MLDTHLDPTKPIDDYDAITWCKWLMAGGPNYELFAKKVREYDSSVMCGLVWTANFVAYRCRTCAISPCMSLCADCFQAGNHEGHDYNMFRSQAGGACDCGDVNVMNAAGFCPRHGPENQQAAPNPPAELLAVSQAMMPRIFMRLIFYLREISDPSLPTYTVNMQDAEQYLAFLHSLSDMGAAMRRIMTHALIDSAQYTSLKKGEGNPSFYENSALKYENAVQKLPFPEEFDGFNFDGRTRRRGASTAEMEKKGIELHKNMLEELVFWMVKCEFPQSMVTLLLGLLPDDTYKDAFTEAFVRHYSRISTVLASAKDLATVANRVVHISVQLFSNEHLATRMVTHHGLLSTVITSLTCMLRAILVPSTMTGGHLNRHLVVECERGVMKEHCYWPIVSDLINLLSHRAISHSFLSHSSLPSAWMKLLTSLQGMNLNHRELSQHVEYEPDTYYAAFSAELEISASPMWSLINHCTTPVAKDFVITMVKASVIALEKWLTAVDFGPDVKPNPNQLTFHLPLHRYLAAFLMLGAQEHGIKLQSALPAHSTLCQIMLHPLQIQVCLPQIYAGMWVRNGIQIKGQAMTYIQCHFCYSLADLDIYLLQVCAASLEPDHFMEIVMERFQLQSWLSFERDHRNQSSETEQEVTPELAMLDGALGFLCSLFGIHTYLGITEEELIRLEMASLLCMNDRQHSQLSELMPERSGMSGMGKELFEPTLKTLADYKAPSFEAGVGLNQGSYTPKGFVWEEEFDPVHVLQRAIYRKDFQAAMDRYSEHMRSNGRYKGKNAPWPPYRMPGKISPVYESMYRVLNCSSMHALLFTIFYKALHEVPNLPDSIVYKALHLLNLCLHLAPKTFPSVTPSVSSLVKDGSLRNWYRTTDVKANACEVIHKVELVSTSANDVGEFDLSGSSLEEMFNMQPSVVASFGGPITAAQTGQIPSIAMVSLPTGSDNLSYTVAPSAQSLTTSTDTVKPKYQSQGVRCTLGTEPREKFLGESIISMLIKLHDKMASPGTVYKPAAFQGSSSSSEVLVGDGAFYIARFLNRLNASSTTASRYIHSTCQDLHVEVDPEKKDDKEKSDSKRKKAFNRQQKLMAQFASKQKAFLAQAQDESSENLEEEEQVDSKDSVGASSVPSGHQYDCVICNQSAPSKLSRPFGLVIFLQSTSVLGHRQQTDNRESLTAAPSQDQMDATRCGGILRHRFTQLLTHFEEPSCNMSVNIGWEGGVFVTTCGHYLHLDCQRSYIDTLRTQPQTETISINRGEYYCPMCRQLSNAVLPIVPDDQGSSLAKPVATNPVTMVNDLAEMMYQGPVDHNLQEVMLVMRHTMDAIYNVTYKVFRGLAIHDSSSKKVLFIYSIARTNLEMEVLLRNGTLQQPLPASSSKKMCILPLLHLLSLHSKVVLGTPALHTQLWSHITGVPLSADSSSLSPYTQQVPLFFKDLVSQLVQILLMLPLTIDIKQYLFVVEKLYCATYMQALATISCRFTQEERDAWRKKGAGAPDNSLEKWLSFIIDELSHSPLFEEVDAGNILPAICQSVWSPQSVEASVQEFCLPYLRVASLLRLYIFGPELPTERTKTEFEMLVDYLGLKPTSRPSMVAEVTGSACLRWALQEPSMLVKAWCHHVNNFAKLKVSECRSLLSVEDKWVSPHLLALPERYYEIFTLYRHQTCKRCQRTPKDPAICLICGAFLCFRENCCVNETSNVFECVEHSVLCGAGTGIFLLVNSSIIVVLRGPRATLWGSLYLDQHGEEDRDLKRGKPLYLSPERLQLLENQWVNHTFEQSCKRWIWHRDRL